MKEVRNGTQHSKEKQAEFLTYSPENDLQEGCCSHMSIMKKFSSRNRKIIASE